MDSIPIATRLCWRLLLVVTASTHLAAAAALAQEARELRETSPLGTLSATRVLTFADSAWADRIPKLLVDQEGRFVLVGSQQGRFWIVDRNGRFVNAFGRPGDGPGEYRPPIVAAMGGGDSLHVFDRAFAPYGPRS